MYKVIVATFGFVCVALASPGITRQALAAQQLKTQWDGVYSAEQAKRGESLYRERCVSCHGADLRGDIGPGLVGSEFVVAWKDRTLGELFEQMRATMPQDSPGGLTPEQYADLLAFVLHEGGYPTGEEPLPGQTEALQAYKFVAAKP